jgi:hypothetical protein
MTEKSLPRRIAGLPVNDWTEDPRRSYLIMLAIQVAVAEEQGCARFGVRAAYEDVMDLYDELGAALSSELGRTVPRLPAPPVAFFQAGKVTKERPPGASVPLMLFPAWLRRDR